MILSINSISENEILQRYIFSFFWLKIRHIRWCDGIKCYANRVDWHSFCFPWVCTHDEIQTPHPWFSLIMYPMQAAARRLIIAVGADPRNTDPRNTNPRNTNPRNTNLIVFFILIKNSVVYFTGIKNLRFTSPPILCHHFVVAFVIIVVASTRWLIFVFLCLLWVQTTLLLFFILKNNKLSSL